MNSRRTARRRAVALLLLQTALFTFGPSYCRALMAGDCHEPGPSACCTATTGPRAAAPETDDRSGPGGEASCPIHRLDAIRVLPAGESRAPDSPGVQHGAIVPAVESGEALLPPAAAKRSPASARSCRGRPLFLLHSVYRL